mgnify:CR=1 FL=1
MGGYCMDEEALFVFAAQNKRLAGLRPDAPLLVAAE